MTTWKVGDRVRMVQTDDMVGTIVKEAAAIGEDGGLRATVLWDRSGRESEWNPGFLRPADTRAADDPDEVVCGFAGRRRGRVTFDGTCTVVVPDGFFRVSEAGAQA